MVKRRGGGGGERGGRVPGGIALVPVALAAAVGCGDPARDAGGYAETDSAGIRIVESLAPAWAEGSYRIDPEPLVRIGREDEGPYRFTFLADAVLLDGGAMAVAEGRAQEVRIFDASGEHLASFGRRGEGPGEFAGLSRVVPYAGDSIAAYDARLYRTTIFSTSSGGHRTFRNQVDGNYALFGIVPGGPILLYHGGTSYRPDLEPGMQWVPSSILAMEPADGAAREIARLPHALRNVQSTGDAPMPAPLQHSVQAVADGGFYWGTGDRWEIGFYDVEGRLRRLLRRSVDPSPVEPSMIDAYIETQLERVRRTEGESAVPRYLRSYEEAEYLDVLPHFTIAFVDREERLWVGSSEWPESVPPRRWSVFSPEGRWLGDLVAPEGVRIVDARADVVLGIGRDAFDVPHVQVHRLIGG